MPALFIPRRRLGRTELSIPVVPFGTLGFSNQFGFVSDEDAVALIKHAISLVSTTSTVRAAMGIHCANSRWL